MGKRFFTENELRLHWSNGSSLKFRNKNYKVHKMSYGDYFLEPSNMVTRETDKFSSKTIWLEKTIKINQYGCKVIGYEVE